MLELHGDAHVCAMAPEPAQVEARARKGLPLTARRPVGNSRVHVCSIRFISVRFGSV